MERIIVYEYYNKGGLIGYSLMPNCKKHIWNLSRLTGKRQAAFIASHLGIPTSWVKVVRANKKEK